LPTGEENIKLIELVYEKNFMTINNWLAKYKQITNMPYNQDSKRELALFVTQTIDRLAKPLAKG